MLLVAVKHKSFKMFAHKKTKWHCALLRAASALMPTPRLDLTHTTIDKQLGTSDKAAVVRTQKQNCFGNFVRGAHAAHRNVGREPRLGLLSLFLALAMARVDGRIDGAGAYGVH